MGVNMSNKSPNNNDGLLELLKKVWLPVASFISAVTLAYNFYKLWLGDQERITYFTAGAGLLALLIALAWVEFSRKTITRKSEVPFGRTRTEKLPAYPRVYRNIARFVLVLVIVGMAIGGYSLVQGRQNEAVERRAREEKLIIAVAVFEGPEEVYGLRNEILESLNAASLDRDEIEIVTVSDVITPDMGSSYARELGRQLIADIVIWGWYRPTEDPNITIHIENLSPTQIEALQESETYEPQATLAQLESFEIQKQIGSETSSLIAFLIGTLKYKSGDYQAAIKQFEQLRQQNDISTFISQSDLFFNLGYSNYQSGNYESAILSYDKAAEIDPGSIKVYINRALAYYWLDQYERAIQDYNEAIKIDPTYAYAYNNRGLTYLYLEQYEPAIQDFDEAIKLDPGYAIAYGNRGVVYEYLEQYERAIQDYDRAIELDPQQANFYDDRADVYYLLEQYKRATQDYDKAIELDPQIADYYNDRAATYEYLEQYERAIQDYDKAIELDPQIADYYNDRADTFYQFEQYDRAIQDYSKTIEIDPDYAYAYARRGDAYQALGKTAEAEADIKKYEELTGQKP